MNWPYLHLWIDFGFFEVRSALMYRHVEQSTFSYVVFYVKLFRWKFEIDLYETRKRWLDRQKKENKLLVLIKEAFPFLWYEETYPAGTYLNCRVEGNHFVVEGKSNEI